MGDTMAFFSKKPEYEPQPWVAPAPDPLASPATVKYDIADAIGLMRSLNWKKRSDNICTK